MSLVSPFEMFSQLSAGKAIGAFNVIQIEHAQAIVSAAEEMNAPVFLQLSQNAIKYHGALAPIGLAMLSIAQASSAQVAVHLDHADDLTLISEAISLGFNSIMFDGSHLTFADNVSTTKSLSSKCRDAGIWLEAELGEIGGKDGVHSPTVRTKPEEAAAFVSETAVDGLAVAVGSSHAMTTKEAALDVDLISTIHKVVDVPLVLHGSSGVSDENIAAAIRAGIRKINVSTDLNQKMTQAIFEYLSANPNSHDPRKYLEAARTAVKSAVSNYLHIFGY